MTDPEQAKLDGEDTTQVETTTTEEKTLQQENQPDAEEATGEEDKGPASDEDQSKKPDEVRKPRGERRIGQLTKKLHEKDGEKADNPADNQPTTPPWNGDQDPFSVLDELADKQVPLDQLKTTMAQVVDSVVTARLTQSQNQQQFQEEAKQIETSLETDIADIQKEDKRLDPASDQYDPEFDQFITETFEMAFKGNSKVRLKDIYNKTVKIVSKASDSGKSEAESSLDKQANEGALTPSMGSKTKKSYKEETLEEMEARIPKVY